MEEKLTQKKIKSASVEKASVESTKEADSGMVKTIHNKQEESEISIDIQDNRQETPIPDDVTLVSPDEAIFTRATEWHDDNSDAKDDFVIDEMYASTAHADRRFMETFGINTTGSVKAVTEKEIQGLEIEDAGEAASNVGYEYTERLQNQEIKSMYDYAVRGMGKRLVVSLIFTVLLFLLENITLFIKSPSGIFDISAYPYVHLGVSTGALIICAICAYEQIYHGFRSIVSRDFLPESVGVVALIVSLIHSVTSIVLVSFGYNTPSMFNFAACAILVGTILYSFVNIVREEYGFRAISGKDSKFVLEKVQQANAEAEYDTFTTTSNGEFNGQIARVAKTDFVKNYFYNTNANVSIRKFMSIYYLIALLVPAVFAVISAVKNSTAVELTAYWGMGVILMLPIGVLCSYSVPFYLGNKRLFEDGVAIIGEEAIEEFASSDVVVVNDTTAFPPQNIKIQNLHIYSDFTIETVLYYASNGFSIVGGPLAEVFDAAANETIAPSKKVRFLCSGRSYLCVKVDGEKVFFADKFGMTSQGIDVGNDTESRDDVCAMYMAIDGVLAAKLYIKYEMDDDFIRIVKMINKSGTGIGIRSFDPNLNNDLIKKLSQFKKKELRVIKLTSINELSRATAAKDSKIVSKGLSRSLIKAIPVCKKILSTRKVIKAIKIIASIGGAVLLGLWTFGKLDFAYSAHIVGYHFVFVVVMMLASLVSMPKLK